MSIYGLELNIILNMAFCILNSQVWVNRVQSSVSMVKKSLWTACSAPKKLKDYKNKYFRKKVYQILKMKESP